MFGIQDRSSRPEARRPYVVRWKVDGVEHSRARRTKTEADRFRSRLLVAQQDGERFDRLTGLPESWLPRGEDVQLHEWARRWVAEQWPEWAPRTRRNDVYALARLLPLVCESRAPAPPDAMRDYLVRSLRPDVEVDAGHECERWLHRWSLTLGNLDRTVLALASQKLGVGDKGQQLGSETVRRYRRTAHSCIRRAVELDQITSDPWPPAPRGRSRRKVNRSRAAVDVRSLPDADAAVAIIQAIKSHQPGSRNYQLMSAVVFYAGLRPSEVAMLRPGALQLPDSGWGSIAVVEADDGWDEPAEPKTGARDVPIHPVLVQLLRGWLDEYRLDARALLFRTRGGRRPSQSNWARALGRACRISGHPRIRVYDLRHSAATLWIRSGVSLAETARRLGHSVETLVSTYIGAMHGDEAEANFVLDKVLRELPGP